MKKPNLGFPSFVCLATTLTFFPAFGQQTDSTRMQDETVGQSQTQTGTETQTQGSTVQRTSEKKVEERQKVANEAAEVIKAMTEGADRKVPAAILNSARAVAVIPDVIKGAFIAGGRFGEGLMLARKTGGGWSDTPSYVEIGGASIGFQAGVTESDLVVLFMNEKAVESILDGKLDFGGEIAAVAGPNSADASFKVQSSEPIYTYSRSGGLFAGVSLDGAYLSIDSSANRDVYGRDVTARQLLVENDVQPQNSRIVEPFVQSVRNIPAASMAQMDTQTQDRDRMITDRDSTEATETAAENTAEGIGDTAQEAGQTALDAGETAAEGVGEAAQEVGEAAHEAGETAAEGVQEAAQGVGDTAEEAGETAHQAGENVAEGAGEAVHDAGDKAEEAGETAHQAGENVVEGAGEAAHGVGDKAEETGETAHQAGENVAEGAGEAADQAASSTRMGESESDRGDNAQVARESAEVIKEMTRGAESRIPESVLQNAHAIAVVPNLVKGAAIVGGKFGEGIVAAKTGGTWGPTPAFIDVAGGSVGLQLGATETDLILVFASKEALDNLLDGKLELGAEASVVAGPTGASADTSGTSGSVYAYTRKEGAYAGAAVDGLVINIDDSANKEVYGSEMSARALLTGEAGQQAQANSIFQPVLDALSAQSTRRAE